MLRGRLTSSQSAHQTGGDVAIAWHEQHALTTDSSQRRSPQPESSLSSRHQAEGSLPASVRPSTSPLSTPKSSQGYFELYPERKGRTPYVPKATLTSCANAPSSKKVANLDDVTARDRSVPNKCAGVPNERSARDLPSSRSTRLSRTRGGAHRAEANEANTSTMYETPVAPKIASSTGRQANVPSTYAASSLALGKSRSGSIQLVSGRIPTIDEIVRQHGHKVREAELRSPKLATSSQSSQTAVSSTPVYRARDEGFDPPTEDLSDDSLDSIAQEIQEGMGFSETNSTSRVNNRNASVQVYNHDRLPSQAEDQAGVRQPSSSHIRPGSKSGYQMSHASHSSQDVGAPDPREPFIGMAPEARSGNSSDGSGLDHRKLTNLMMLQGRLDYTLKVSYADVGAPRGHPVFVFLGLGAVRHLVGLYDEVASTLGLRLICIDRWGLGRTDNVPTERRSILGWSPVVLEVADRLGIHRFSLLAHSAGAPYAMGLVLMAPERILGPVNLLCPWTGTSTESGYRWLKYVPDGVIRTAQAAEWKLQSWRLGKGANDGTKSPARANESRSSDSVDEKARSRNANTGTETSFKANMLHPFEGLDDSVSQSGYKLAPPFGDETLIASRSEQSLSSFVPERHIRVHPPRSFSGGTYLDNSSTRQEVKAPTVVRSKSSFFTNLLSPRQTSNSFQEPQIEGDDVDKSTWRGSLSPNRQSLSRSTSSSSVSASYMSKQERPASASIDWEQTSELRHYGLSRSDKALPAVIALEPTEKSGPAEPGEVTVTSAEFSRDNNKEVEMDFGAALLRASHAESFGGSALDLSLILGKRPWGFDFTDIQHSCRIWHGSKDDRIGLGSSLWMERQLRDCSVKVVEGAGHNLMTNSAVILEVLEHIQHSASILG